MNEALGFGVSNDRDLVAEYLHRQLIGPVGGPDETVSGEAPHKRYLAGILFPMDLCLDFTDEGEEEEASAASSSDEGLDNPITLAGQLQPSSVGVTFVIAQGSGVRVEIRLGKYQKNSSSKTSPSWVRTPIELTGDLAVRLAAGDTEAPIFDGRATLNAVWRPFGRSQIVTVTLVNRAKRTEQGRFDPSDCLLQVELKCIPELGAVRAYPVSKGLLSDHEEEELAVLYRGVPNYGIGHGAAAIWGPPVEDGVAWVATAFMPKVVVPGVSATLEGNGEVLTFDFLARAGEDAEVFDQLNAFIDRYKMWANSLRKQAKSLPAHQFEAGERLVGRVDDTVRRMSEGVHALTSDPRAATAFAYANRVMLMQMLRSGEDFAGSRHNRNYKIPPTPTSDSSKGWRPFQLGFILSTLASIVDELSPDRDQVDLLWFPTGGGKTEAYLGLVAFTIFHRRLVLGDAGAGTAVITRYTLRLVTAQQFQRTATMICAAELVRRHSGGLFGSSIISLGLWVGGSNTPNTYKDAVQLLAQLCDGESPNQSFQIDLCPWCGTELVDLTDTDTIGISATNSAVRFNCPNKMCDFHDLLPLTTVDADIYDRPPTMLIGTVDKFAQLAWEGKSGVLLGSGSYPGPSLVIQDEFHLISGPLGSIVGAYEAAFSVVMAANGVRPKMIASTATIRRADQQSRGVFGRGVHLFPPSGLDANDSYFVRTDRTSPGRLYVGVMPQGHTPLTAMVHLSAALLQSAEDVPLSESGADAYWTLVAYHNSLRELGKSVTLAHDDIPSRIAVISETEDGLRNLPSDSIIELTSQVRPAEIPGKIETLKKPKGQDAAASFVASTNMISVGVDVPRLGLMIIVGQPKTTSEYIQASSRVGRSSPGLVVTLFSPSKPRDRSHYEGFVAYHESLYRSVEPTSVTPFSAPARQRALPASIIVMARHAGGLPSLQDADSFTPDAQNWIALKEAFLERVHVSDPDELEAVRAEVARLESDWVSQQSGAASSGGLRYSTEGRSHRGLMRRFTDSGAGWPTLDSMRNVDSECRIQIQGEK